MPSTTVRGARRNIVSAARVKSMAYTLLVVKAKAAAIMQRIKICDTGHYLRGIF